ncbi:MAG TPA: DUF4115 domain-containing protein [Thauera sp.]|nr:DUF4115 domain-containing protein [Thauera sp.]
MSRIQSPEPAVPAPDPTQPSPGLQLRQAREQRGESVGEVAFALKLHPRQIVALESDDFDALPGTAFVRGFMRNYARYLGRDPAPLLDGVQRLAGQAAVDLSPIQNADGELPSGGAQRMGAAPVGWILALALVLVLAGWYFDWFRTPAPAVEQALEMPLIDPQSIESVPASALTQDSKLPQPVDADPMPTPPDQGATATGEQAVVQEQGAQGGALAPADPGATESPAAVATPDKIGAATVEEVAVAPAPSTVAAQHEALGAQLAFRFGGESWVEVRDAQGAIVYSGVNRAGSTRMVQGTPPFALVVGNAASVSLEFNGKPVDLVAHTKVSVARLTVQ